MKKQYALALALTALVVGVFAGAGGASEFWSAWYARDQMVSTEVALTGDLLVLKELQAGRVDQAKEKLEQNLDFRILSLDAIKREHEELQREAFSSLPSVSDYRSSVPYVSQDERVSRILKLAK